MIAKINVHCLSSSALHSHVDYVLWATTNFALVLLLLTLFACVEIMYNKFVNLG